MLLEPPESLTGQPPLIDCPWLIIKYIGRLPSICACRLLHTQLEDAPCRVMRDTLVLLSSTCLFMKLHTWWQHRSHRASYRGRHVSFFYDGILWKAQIAGPFTKFFNRGLKYWWLWMINEMALTTVTHTHTHRLILACRRRPYFRTHSLELLVHLGKVGTIITWPISLVFPSRLFYLFWKWKYVYT